MNQKTTFTTIIFLLSLLVLLYLDLHKFGHLTSSTVKFLICIFIGVSLTLLLKKYNSKKQLFSNQKLNLLLINIPTPLLLLFFSDIDHAFLLSILFIVILVFIFNPHTS